MENAGYATLSRQAGLMREMQVIANNIANAATTGYRQEGLSFVEHVRRVEGASSISMAHAHVRTTSMEQGALVQTRAPLDLAIEGEGFFLVGTAAGERLTRAGSFTPAADGTLVTPDGDPVLDAGGATIFVPPDAGALSISPDGTISAGDRPLGQIAVMRPVDPIDLTREDGVRFSAPGGIEPAPDARVLQGYLERANVDAIGQIARMIEVQRAYETGAKFLDAENERIRDALRTFIK